MDALGDRWSWCNGGNSWSNCRYGGGDGGGVVVDVDDGEWLLYGECTSLVGCGWSWMMAWPRPFDSADITPAPDLTNKQDTTLDCLFGRGW